MEVGRRPLGLEPLPTRAIMVLVVVKVGAIRSHLWKMTLRNPTLPRVLHTHAMNVSRIAHETLG